MPNKLSDLPADSISVSAETRLVRIDKKTNPEVEHTYLTINGNPQGYRWLANQLTQMAKSAEESNTPCSAIVAPWDFANQPISLSEWDSIDLTCRPIGD